VHRLEDSSALADVRPRRQPQPAHQPGDLVASRADQTRDAEHFSRAHLEIDAVHDVFGAIRSQGGSSNNNRLFTGEQRDSDSSFYYLRARYYDAHNALFGVPLVIRKHVSLVQMQPGEALLDHLHAVGLSKYDMPEYFIAMDAFPLTASGKILKRELQEWAKSGRIAPQPVRWSEPVKEG